MFGLLMDHPGDAMTGEEIAAAVGRPLLCRYEEPMTPDVSGTYWIDEAVAGLFRAVREG